MNFFLFFSNTYYNHLCATLWWSSVSTTCFHGFTVKQLNSFEFITRKQQMSPCHQKWQTINEFESPTSLDDNRYFMHSKNILNEREKTQNAVDLEFLFSKMRSKTHLKYQNLITFYFDKLKAISFWHSPNCVWIIDCSPFRFAFIVCRICH